MCMHAHTHTHNALCCFPPHTRGVCSPHGTLMVLTGACVCAHNTVAPDSQLSLLSLLYVRMYVRTYMYAYSRPPSAVCNFQVTSSAATFISQPFSFYLFYSDSASSSKQSYFSAILLNPQAVLVSTPASTSPNPQLTICLVFRGRDCGAPAPLNAVRL